MASNILQKQSQKLLPFSVVSIGTGYAAGEEMEGFPVMMALKQAGGETCPAGKPASYTSSCSGRAVQSSFRIMGGNGRRKPWAGSGGEKGLSPKEIEKMRFSC